MKWWFKQWWCLYQELRDLDLGMGFLEVLIDCDMFHDPCT